MLILWLVSAVPTCAPSSSTPLPLPETAINNWLGAYAQQTTNGPHHGWRGLNGGNPPFGYLFFFLLFVFLSLMFINCCSTDVSSCRALMVSHFHFYYLYTTTSNDTTTTSMGNSGEEDDERGSRRLQVYFFFIFYPFIYYRLRCTSCRRQTPLENDEGGTSLSSPSWPKRTSRLSKFIFFSFIYFTN